VLALAATDGIFNHHPVTLADSMTCLGRGAHLHDAADDLVPHDQGERPRPQRLTPAEDAGVRTADPGQFHLQQTILRADRRQVERPHLHLPGASQHHGATLVLHAAAMRAAFLAFFSARFSFMVFVGAFFVSLFTIWLFMVQPPCVV
jgi:hypothetical protein